MILRQQDPPENRHCMEALASGRRMLVTLCNKGARPCRYDWNLPLRPPPRTLEQGQTDWREAPAPTQARSGYPLEAAGREATSRCLILPLIASSGGATSSV